MADLNYIQKLLELKEKIDQSSEKIFTEADFIKMAIGVGFSWEQAQDIFDRSMSEDKPLEVDTTGNSQTIVFH